MILHTAALSDIGLIRQENEDRYLLDDQEGIYGIADGIGGLPYGAEAAARAVEIVQRLLVGTPLAKRPARIYDAVLSANREVHRLGLELSPSRGVGSTLTFGSVAGNLLCLAHVGDSRCYRLHKGELIQLTSDHNVENELKARKARGESYIPYLGNGAALTRCIGQLDDPVPDLLSLEMNVGDQFLFCSDGITRSIPNEEIKDILLEASSAADALDTLVSLSLERGGHDNATGVLLRVDA